MGCGRQEQFYNCADVQINPAPETLSDTSHQTGFLPLRQSPSFMSSPGTQSQDFLRRMREDFPVISWPSGLQIPHNMMTPSSAHSQALLNVNVNTTVSASSDTPVTGKVYKTGASDTKHVSGPSSTHSPSDVTTAGPSNPSGFPFVRGIDLSQFPEYTSSTMNSILLTYEGSADNVSVPEPEPEPTFGALTPRNTKEESPLSVLKPNVNGNRKSSITSVDQTDSHSMTISDFLRSAHRIIHKTNQQLGHGGHFQSGDNSIKHRFVSQHTPINRHQITGSSTDNAHSTKSIAPTQRRILPRPGIDNGLEFDRRKWNFTENKFPWSPPPLNKTISSQHIINEVSPTNKTKDLLNVHKIKLPQPQDRNKHITAIVSGSQSPHTSGKTSSVSELNRKIGLPFVNRNIGLPATNRNGQLPSINRNKGLHSINKTTGSHSINRTIGPHSINRTMGLPVFINIASASVDPTRRTNWLSSIIRTTKPNRVQSPQTSDSVGNRTSVNLDAVVYPLFNQSSLVTESKPRVKVKRKRCDRFSIDFRCKALDHYSTLTNMDHWCNENCAAGHCPDNICQCGCGVDIVIKKPRKNCTAMGAFAKIKGMNEWCRGVCRSERNKCPSNICDITTCRK